jgi:hypothetical protein
MAAGYTAFMTYMLSGNTSGVRSQGYGYSGAIHCNYINKIQFDTILNKEFNVYFKNENDFKFLSTSGGTGFTAHKLYVIAQLIDNSSYNSIDDVKPISSAWKMFDVTNQIIDYVSGSTLSKSDLSSTVFRVPISQYQLAKTYNLDYLNYPSNSEGSSDLLCFGDETYFLGNVKTSVEAIAYTMDLAINLPLDQFNSSNNETWDSTSDQVYISEIGLYDSNKNLVGIAKLNNPIPKDRTISRTIVFAMDF